MKIAAVFEDRLSSGGGFHQAINALLQMQRLAAGHGDELVVYVTDPASAPPLTKLGLTVALCRPGLSDRIVRLAHGNSAVRSLVRATKLVGNLERQMLSDGCDLVYFVTPGSRCLSFQQLNYVATQWDLCHRDFPEFPESRVSREFQRRETTIRATLPQAVLTLVDSDTLKQNLVRRYGVDGERVIAMPFAAAGQLDAAQSLPTEAVISKLQLQPGYLFYPAQIWPHKNHVRLIQALAILRDQGSAVRLVLAGGDKQNGPHVRALAERLGVSNQLVTLGFVDPDCMRGLYDACAAVVMPTYFGPTNLPPFEAWTMGKPLVYPQHLAAGVGPAAVLFDVDSATDLARAVTEVLQPEKAVSLAALGKMQLASLAEERRAAEDDLCLRLRQFASRRETWK